MQIIKKDGGKFLVQSEAHIPVIGEYDVVVAGGGSAGIGAAVGAARAGAKTLLIERNSALGGIATAGLMQMLWICGHSLVGAARELFHRLKELDAADMGHKVSFSPEMAKNIALQMVLEANAEVLFYTMVTSPMMEGNTMKGLVIENKSGRQAVLAKTVIDCTGDADIAFRAGAPTNTGREDDHKMRPMSLLFRVGNVNITELEEYCRTHPDQVFPNYYPKVADIKDRMMRIGGFYDLIDAARARGEIDKNIHYINFEAIDTVHGVAMINTTRAYGLDGSNAFELTKGEIECRKQMLELVEFMKKYMPGFKDIYLVDAGSNLGVRETRRIIGEYVYTDADAYYKKKYEDTVLHMWRRSGLNKELHTPDAGEGIRNEEFYEGLKKYDPNSIPGPTERDFYFPYRSLIPQKLEGLLVAGRCMSVSHLGDTWTRGIMICLACGQAAGVAAALSAKQAVDVREVAIEEIRKELKTQGSDTGY